MSMRRLPVSGISTGCVLPYSAMAASTRSSLRGQRRYSTATPVLARAATDSMVSR
jgi:hypothetical protein